MGLDQYLTARQYIPNIDYNEKNNTEFNLTLKKTINDLNLKKNIAPNPFNVSGLEFDLIKWRKANQIHGWFVQNVQEGIDNCGRYFIDEDVLMLLLADCKNVLKHKGDLNIATKLLPPTEGFFFGDNQIDEDYWDDIQMTAEQLEIIIESGISKYCDFHYSSSW